MFDPEELCSIRRTPLAIEAPFQVPFFSRAEFSHIQKRNRPHLVVWGPKPFANDQMDISELKSSPSKFAQLSVRASLLPEPLHIHLLNSHNNLNQINILS